MPTTFQVCAAELDVAAERQPLEAADRQPADVDLARARREAAPFDELQVSRTSNACGPTPRTGTLAG